MKRILGAILLFYFFVPIFVVHAEDKIKILLVPGHDNDVWGAQYGNLKESAMNLAVANRIFNILKKDKNFEVYITRNSGGYVEEFADYFINQKDNIALFKQNAKKSTQEKIKSGVFLEKDNVYHVKASEDTALKLYGFNKWANEKKIDAVIHIHFNDYPRENSWTKGIHKGFVIYIPDKQMKNSKESELLARDIFTQIRKKYITSTYPPELGGIVYDQKLIALGSNETLSEGVRSVLIECAYIYRVGNKEDRQKLYNNMASFISKGIKNYFLP